MSIECALFGTLTRDAEPKVSKAGKSYLKLNVRVGDGDSVVWVSVMAFGVDELATKLLKGAALYLEGSIRMDEWTAQDGSVKHGLSVMARRVELSAIGKNRPRKDGDSRPTRSNNSPEFDDTIPF
jgi:single-stranded DNA-binding protein